MRRRERAPGLMRFGLHALGVGDGAQPGVLEAVASGAERVGFSTLWAGEHVVMFDEQASRYPYAADGRIAVPAEADWLDPFVCLSFAAACTEHISIATGVLLLPEHNPVIVAKRAASLDRLSRGRLTLGVGIGWSAEEFAALGVPFERRGARTLEYVAAMRAIWREDPASFAGEHVSFEGIRVRPKPERPGGVPVFFGGNSDAALARVAAHGDGWYGFALDGVASVRERVQTLAALHEQHGSGTAPIVAVSVAGGEPSDVAELEAIGVDELVIVEAPPPREGEVDDWIAALAARWIA